MWYVGSTARKPKTADYRMDKRGLCISPPDRNEAQVRWVLNDDFIEMVLQIRLRRRADIEQI